LTERADPATSRAVLIGASRYDVLESLLAVENNLSRLTELLTDPGVWGLAPAHVATVLNPPSRDDALDVIHEAASEAQDTIFVYFAGHGLLERSNSALHLALPRASATRLHRALRYDDVRREITRTCQARSKVVVLDCCFSGQAMDGFMAAAPDMADQARIEGTYLMTASAKTALALAEPGEQYTAFTGELVRAIEQGLPDGPALLDMGTLYSQVRASLLAKGRPEPQERARNDGRSIALVRNQWHSGASGDASPTASRGEAADLTHAVTARKRLDEGERIARSIRMDPVLVEALVELAVACGNSDPQRSQRLAAEAEQLTEAILDPQEKALALARVARALVAAGSRHATRVTAEAERIAESLEDESTRAEALADVARALLDADPDHAARIAERAAEIALSLRSPRLRPWGQLGVTRAIAPIDPGRAEYLAVEITDDDQYAQALHAVALALTDDDPHGAARVARMIQDPAVRDEALATIAPALVLVDIRQTGRLVQDITGSGLCAQALAAMAHVTAERDPEAAAQLTADAEKYAAAIPDDGTRAESMAALAYELHPSAPQTAERLATDAETIAHALPDAWQRAQALAKTARAFARIDPEHAERIPRSITDDEWKTSALADIAKTLAPNDLPRAERLTRTITDPESQSLVLIELVRCALCMDS
jgi:hypothetical protein